MMGYYNGYGGYGPMMGWGSGFGWIFQFVFSVLIIATIIILIVWIVRNSRHNWHHAMHHGISFGNDALEILKERYAKGEIDKKEYEEKKKDLE